MPLGPFGRACNALADLDEYAEEWSEALPSSDPVSDPFWPPFCDPLGIWAYCCSTTAAAALGPLLLSIVVISIAQEIPQRHKWCNLSKGQKNWPVREKIRGTILTETRDLSERINLCCWFGKMHESRRFKCEID